MLNLEAKITDGGPCTKDSFEPKKCPSLNKFFLEILSKINGPKISGRKVIWSNIRSNPIQNPDPHPVLRIRIQRIRDFSAIRILKEQNIDQNHQKIIHNTYELRVKVLYLLRKE